MEKNIKKMLNNGISLNTIKIIALIFMVIDHFGHYFWYALPNSVYILIRYCGRIAMPLFLFALIQGFFHTKDFRKYISRIFGCAVITQIVITIVYVINSIYYPAYNNLGVSNKANILFSFTICLTIFKILQTDILIKKYDKKTNIVVKIILVMCLLFVYIIIPIDYGIALPLLAICLYYIEKLHISYLISKSNLNVCFNMFIFKSLSDDYIKLIYTALIGLILLIFVFNYETINICTLLALPIIYLYNGQKGYSRKKIKYLYYIVFPIQHFVIYSIAMLLSCNN